MMLGACWKAEKETEAISSTDTNTDMNTPFFLSYFLSYFLSFVLSFCLLLGRQGRERSHRHGGGTDGGDCVVRDVRSARGGDGEEIRLPCLFVQVDNRETGANSTARGVDRIPI